MPRRGALQKDSEWDIMNASSSTTVFDLSHSSQTDGGCPSDVSSLCFGSVEVEGGTDAVITITEESRHNKTNNSAASSRPSSAGSSTGPMCDAVSLVSSLHNSSASHDDEDGDATVPPPELEREIVVESLPATRASRKKKPAAKAAPKKAEPAEAGGPPPKRGTRKKTRGEVGQEVQLAVLEALPEEEQHTSPPKTRSQRGKQAIVAVSRESRGGANQDPDVQHLQNAVREIKLAKDRRRTYVVKIAVNVTKSEGAQNQQPVATPPVQQMAEQQSQELQLHQEVPVIMSLPPPPYSMMSAHPATSGVALPLPEKEDLKEKSDRKDKKNKKKHADKKNKNKNKEKKRSKRRSRNPSTTSEDSSSSSTSTSEDSSSEDCSCPDCQTTESSCSCSSCCSSEKDYKRGKSRKSR